MKFYLLCWEFWLTRVQQSSNQHDLSRKQKILVDFSISTSSSFFDVASLSPQSRPNRMKSELIWFHSRLWRSTLDEQEATILINLSDTIKLCKWMFWWAVKQTGQIDKKPMIAVKLTHIWEWNTPTRFFVGTLIARGEGREKYSQITLRGFMDGWKVDWILDQDEYLWKPCESCLWKKESLWRFPNWLKWELMELNLQRM